MIYLEIGKYKGKYILEKIAWGKKITMCESPIVIKKSLRHIYSSINLVRTPKL